MSKDGQQRQTNEKAYLELPSNCLEFGTGGLYFQVLALLIAWVKRKLLSSLQIQERDSRRF